MAQRVEPIKDGKPRLVRIPEKRIIGGVCAGFAYWLHWPTWAVRALLILLILSVGFGILAYIILWILMPVATETPADYDDRAS
ncbi:MAG: PspC protein [Candidatus Poribacteria bacterium]|nr:PspC protein [Candidatus Poribacteria bacterium]